MLRVLVALFSLLCLPSRAEYRVRSTVYGKVKGRAVELPGIKAEIFHGIPFAKSPVLERRFTHPEKPDPWQGVKDAYSRKSDCVQFWYFGLQRPPGDESEDCLYLSVFLPVTPMSRNLPIKLFPVLVWIHGGSYTVGGPSNFPDEGVVKNLVSRGLVVVIPSYRLGPLGFLSLLNESCPGNFGLADQIAALEWVTDNIKHFNGDSNRITVSGESAGASSASLLAVSPRSRDLFHRVIVRSGSALSPWAVRSRNTDFNSYSLIAAVDCGGKSNISSTMECMRSVPVARVMEAWNLFALDDRNMFADENHVPLHYNHPLMAHTFFTPVIDRFMQQDSIIPAYVEELLSNFARKPIMIGVVTAECTGFGLLLAKSVARNDGRFNMKLLVPDVLYRNVAQVHSAVRRKYLKAAHLLNTSLAVDPIIQAASDLSFVAPTLSETVTYAEAGADVFLYSFNFTHQAVVERYTSFGLLNTRSSPHGSDMVYLMESSKMIDGNEWGLNFTDKDHRITGTLADHIANFVRTGHPSSEDKWPRFSNYKWENVYVYTDRNGDRPRIKRRLRDGFVFWRETIPSLDAAVFRDNAEPCVSVDSTDSVAASDYYRYAFFIAISCCAVFVLSTFALAFVHFGRGKAVFSL